MPSICMSTVYLVVGVRGSHAIVGDCQHHRSRRSIRSQLGIFQAKGRTATTLENVRYGRTFLYES